jgi:hypothetical protein
VGLFLLKRSAIFAPVIVGRLGIALALGSIVVEDLVAIRNIHSLSKLVATTPVSFQMEGLRQETEKSDWVVVTLETNDEGQNLLVFLWKSVLL